MEPLKISDARGPVLAWSGDDPIQFSRVLGALKDAKITYFQLSNQDQLAFQPITPRPGYGIFVRSEDAPRAAGIVRDAIEQNPPESEARENQ